MEGTLDGGEGVCKFEARPRPPSPSPFLAVGGPVAHMGGGGPVLAPVLRGGLAGRWGEGATQEGGRPRMVINSPHSPPSRTRWKQLKQEKQLLRAVAFKAFLLLGFIHLLYFLLLFSCLAEMLESVLILDLPPSTCK